MILELFKCIAGKHNDLCCYQYQQPTHIPNECEYLQARALSLLEPTKVIKPLATALRLGITDFSEWLDGHFSMKN